MTTFSKYMTYKIKSLYNSDNTCRLSKTIYLSSNNQLSKILIILQNPTKDNTPNCIYKTLIDKFINDINYKDNIYSICIINLISIISSDIKSELLLYDNNNILNILEENKLYILNLISKNNYNEIFIGCGQHFVNFETNIKKFIFKLYKDIIIQISLNNCSKIKYFGKFVYNNLIPCCCCKRNNNTFTDTTIEDLLLKLKKL